MLAIDGVHLRYGGVPALQGIDLEVTTSAPAIRCWGAARPISSWQTGRG